MVLNDDPPVEHLFDGPPQNPLKFWHNILLYYYVCSCTMVGSDGKMENLAKLIVIVKKLKM